ncbi:MAG: transglutaminase-like putative cysteine protease [Neolewinella sp.]|jgi:transglutaminase-like putative cysteine protease
MSNANSTDGAPASLRRMASISLFAATVLALSNLPASELPIPWLLAFTIPGAIIGSWSRLNRPRWLRVLFAIALQASACYGALEWVGPMTRPAALACTILPPLAFATARNHDGDPSLALFLSFCVMLVGVILDGVDMRLLIAYGAFGFLSLHVATLLQSYRTSKPSRTRTPLQAADVMATSLMMLSCMVSVFAIDRTLSCLPSPSQGNTNSDDSASNPSADRQVGLDDSFILDGGNGILSELSGEQLARVRRPDQSDIESGLYLRCGFFTVPSMDRWRIGALSLGPQSSPDGHVLGAPWRGFQTYELEIERFGGAAKFVFLPPDTVQLAGLPDLLIDQRREWVRLKRPNQANYLVSYQKLPDPGRRASLSRADIKLGLTNLPAGIDIDRFEQLLEEWQVPRDPRRAMAAIADGLASRCRYARSEPVGPFAHRIENFLFADVDRHGYCMHFASAAALMLRMRGIPCRIGVGLYGGKADKEVPNARMFGSQHAHAWVEVLYEDRIFIFDPTPPDSRGRATAMDRSSGENSDPEVEINESLIDPFLRLLSTLIGTPATWAVLLGLVILITLMPRRQPKPPARQRVITAPKARRALQKLLRALAKAGHRRFPGQTLELFATDLSELERLPPEVSTAFTTYQEVRFGGREFDQQRAQHMEHGLRAAIAMRTND